MHVESEDAANDRASVAISQASYDSLRKSVDTLRDQFREAQDGRSASCTNTVNVDLDRRCCSRKIDYSPARGRLARRRPRIARLDEVASRECRAVRLGDLQDCRRGPSFI